MCPVEFYTAFPLCSVQILMLIGSSIHNFVTAMLTDRVLGFLQAGFKGADIFLVIYMISYKIE